MTRTLATVAATLLLGTAAHAQTSVAATPATPAPAVGQPAPDITIARADANGATATPFTLSSLRGKVVVLAFYPKDHTTGCTAELTKFRDDYKQLFGDRAGTDVIVLPISADGITSHAGWVKDANFPFTLGADTALTAATAYGSRMADHPMAQRTVFVIGRDGTIKYRDLKFNALSEDAYTQLKDAVRKAS